MTHKSIVEARLHEVAVFVKSSIEFAVQNQEINRQSLNFAADCLAEACNKFTEKTELHDGLFDLVVLGAAALSCKKMLSEGSVSVLPADNDSNN